MKIVTFLKKKNRETPKRVHDFPLERGTFRNKTLEIVLDFECEAKFLHFSWFIIFRHFFSLSIFLIFLFFFFFNLSFFHEHQLFFFFVCFVFPFFLIYFHFLSFSVILFHVL